ncbi:hypothetical protein Tco_0098203 [Tanacetum coccineum]
MNKPSQHTAPKEEVMARIEDPIQTSPISSEPMLQFSPGARQPGSFASSLLPSHITELKFAIAANTIEPRLRSSQVGVNSAASIRKAVQRRLQGLLRKAIRADEGGKTKDLFWALFRPYESSGRKDFLNRVKELGVADLFLKDGDESMSVDDVKTLLDVEFQKPARGRTTGKGFYRDENEDPVIQDILILELMLSSGEGVFIERGYVEDSTAKEEEKGPSLVVFRPALMLRSLLADATYRENKKRISLVYFERGESLKLKAALRTLRHGQGNRVKAFPSDPDVKDASGGLAQGLKSSIQIYLFFRYAAPSGKERWKTKWAVVMSELHLFSERFARWDLCEIQLVFEDVKDLLGIPHEVTGSTKGKIATLSPYGWIRRLLTGKSLTRLEADTRLHPKASVLDALSLKLGLKLSVLELSLSYPSNPKSDKAEKYNCDYWRGDGSNTLGKTTAHCKQRGGKLIGLYCNARKDIQRVAGCFASNNSSVLAHASLRLGWHSSTSCLVDANTQYSFLSEYTFLTHTHLRNVFTDIWTLATFALTRQTDKERRSMDLMGYRSQVVAEGCSVRAKRHCKVMLAIAIKKLAKKQVRQASDSTSKLTRGREAPPKKRVESSFDRYDNEEVELRSSIQGSRSRQEVALAMLNQLFPFLTGDEPSSLLSGSARTS